MGSRCPVSISTNTPRILFSSSNSCPRSSSRSLTLRRGIIIETSASPTARSSVPILKRENELIICVRSPSTLATSSAIALTSCAAVTIVSWFLSMASSTVRCRLVPTK
jgi:hypothetical protein